MSETAPSDPSPPSRAYKIYVLALLTGVYFFYLLDRNAVLVTQEAFKAEFALTDTQVGLITGLLYGGAYALVGIPLGLVADRVNRPRLLGLLVGIWSAVTALCGLVGQFWQLALARAVVGSAEAGGSPASLSILSDLFSEKRRATISSIFFAGANLGAIVSFLAGGFIVAHFGWRAVFLLYGAPGVALALLIFFTIRDPASVSRTERTRHAEPALRALGGLLSDKALVPVYLGSILYSFSMSGIGVWLVPFLMRTHQVPVTSAGAIVAMAIGLAGGIGSLTIGYLADALQRRREGGTLLVVAATSLVNLIFGVAGALAGNLTLAVVCFCIWGSTAVAYSGPSNAAIARLASAKRRGLAFALFAVLCNFIGAGLGPIVTGAISDLFSATSGATSLRPAIIFLALCQLATASAYLWAASASRRRAATGV